LKSQCFNSLTSLIRSGLERSEFERTAGGYGQSLSPAFVLDLHTVCSRLAHVPPHCASKAKAKKKGRKGGASTGDVSAEEGLVVRQPAAEVQPNDMTAAAVQVHKAPVQRPSPPPSSSTAARTPSTSTSACTAAMAEEEEPQRVAGLRRPLCIATLEGLPVAIASVRNSFIHFDTRSVASAGQKSRALTCPPLGPPGPSSSAGLPAEGKEAECDLTVLAHIAEGDERMPTIFANAQICKGCTAETSEGWPCKDGHFWCESCTSKWFKYKKEWSWVREEAELLPAAHGNPGGPVVRYSSMDPVRPAETFTTEFRVVDACCLEIAKLKTSAANCKPVLLVMGREFGPMSKFNTVQGKKVLAASTFQHAVLASREDSVLPAPRWGGLYVPDVFVHSDGEGVELPDTYRIAMLYAAASRPDRAPPNGFYPEMRDKILNIMRICITQGHDSFILGDWGCGWPGSDPAEMASIFGDVLLGHSDVAGAFRQITFAICESQEALSAFQKRFGTAAHQ